MKLYIFIFIFAFIWINVRLFKNIKNHMYELAVINKVDTPTVTAFLNPKKKKSVKSLFKKYLELKNKTK